jgi:hemoglobin
MRTIENRDDIESLVHMFYAKIRQDGLLGPIFNGHISEEAWPVHLKKLADFWETNLLGVHKFKGSPSQKHTMVDKNLQYTVEQKHFDRWLHLWFETIDDDFVGHLAEKAKKAAGRMAHGQYLVIWKNRPKSMWEEKP